MQQPKPHAAAAPEKTEQERLSRLRDHDLNPGSPLPEYDELAALAAHLCGASAAFVNIIDSETVWSLGCFPAGSEVSKPLAWPRAATLCARMAQEPQNLLVTDAQEDPRTVEWVAGASGALDFRFYAGLPLMAADGFVLGTLSVIGSTPHALSDSELRGLELVRNQVARLLESRRARVMLERDQQALAQRQEAFEQSMEAAGETFWDWNLVTNEMGHARNRARMLGYGDGELTPHLDAWVGVSHEEDQEPVRQLIRAHLAGHTPEYEAEYRQRHRDGHWIWVRSRGRVVERDPATGKPLRMRGTVVDITRRKELEARIVEMNLELRQALDQAEEAARSKTQFLATMAHEIRTPLNSVVGAARLAMMEEDPQQLEEYLQLVNQASQMLLDLLNTVLDHSRMESGALPVEQLPISLRQLVNQVGQQMAAPARAKGLQWATRVEPSVPPMVLGDSLRLRQVLTNLVGNAVKFTDQGSIEVTARVEPFTPALPAMVCIEVADTGIGLTQEQQSRLFKAFSQADPSIARRYGGTGLGLSISRQIMQALGGTLSLHSEPGRGSTFTLRWPLQVEPSGAMAAPALGSSTEPAPAQQMGQAAGPERGADMERMLAEAGRGLVGRRVLVVDDNRMNVAVVKRLLERAGVQVLTAMGGSEALTILANSAVDLVLLDLYMPEINGDEVARRIRTELGMHQLPVIALSASVTLEERERCAAAGMDEFVSKPIEPLELLSAMSDCLAK